MKEGRSTIYATEIKIIRKHNEQLFTNKLDNFEEMHKFLEAHNLSRLEHTEVENLYISIIVRKVNS